MSCRRPKLQIKPKVGAIRSPMRSKMKSHSNEDNSSKLSATESQSTQSTQSSSSSDSTLLLTQTTDEDTNETTTGQKRTVDQLSPTSVESINKKKTTSGEHKSNRLSASSETQISLDSTQDLSKVSSSESQSLQSTQSSVSTILLTQTSNEDKMERSLNQNNDNNNETNGEKRAADESNGKPVETNKKKRTSIPITYFDSRKLRNSSVSTTNTNININSEGLEEKSHESENILQINENNEKVKSFNTSSKMTTTLTPILDEKSNDSMKGNDRSTQSDNQIMTCDESNDAKNKMEVNDRKKSSLAETESEPINEPNNETIVANEKNAQSEKQKEVNTRNANLSKLSKEINRKRKAAKMRSQTDKTKMTMKDLLLYNPPLTEEQKEQRKYDSESEKSGNEIPNTTDTEVKQSESQESGKSSENNAGPRVKVGADGGLILDEESIIVNRKKNESVEPAVIESAKTTSACTNYSSFRTRTKMCHKPRWNEHETVRFYSALSTIGTDFTLMANIFFKGKRSRLDLRNKFKKEEKYNKLMIDEALSSPNSFINHCEELQDLLSDTSSDDSDDETRDTNKAKVKKESNKEIGSKNKVKP